MNQRFQRDQYSTQTFYVLYLGDLQNCISRSRIAEPMRSIRKHAGHLSDSEGLQREGVWSSQISNRGIPNPKSVDGLGEEITAPQNLNPALGKRACKRI